MNWRKEFDKRLKPYLERMIAESYRYQRSYKKAKDIGKSQLWTGIAILSKQLYELELKLRYIERTLQDIAGPRLKAQVNKELKKEEKEVEKIIKALASGSVGKVKTKSQITKKPLIKKTIKKKTIKKTKSKTKKSSKSRSKNKKKRKFDRDIIKVAKSL